MINGSTYLKQTNKIILRETYYIYGRKISTNHEVIVSNGTKFHKATKLSDLILFKTSRFVTIWQAVGPIQPPVHWGRGVILPGYSDRGLKVSAHFHLMLILRIDGDTRSRPTHMTSSRRRREIYLIFYVS